jgi:predicted small lipoprotein YifL
MARLLPVVLVLASLTGCGRPAGTRAVPVTEVTPAGPAEREPPVTRAPRAIATH